MIYAPLIACRRPVRQAVTRSYQRFTPAERQVADAILHRAAQVVDLPIDRLARELGVSVSVISRFSRGVGFASFRTLRLALAAELGAEAATLDTEPANGRQTGGRGPLWQAARDALHADLIALQRNADGIDPDALVAAAELLASAPRVVTVGYDASGAVAKRLASMLGVHGWRTRAEVHPTDSAWTSDVEAGDVVVAVSHRGPAGPLVSAAQTLRAQGVPVLAITGDAMSPLGQAADAVLTTCVPGGLSDSAYVLDPIWPAQILTMRALVAAATAARQRNVGGIDDATA